MENATASALPDEAKFKQDIQAINRFQQVVHANMVKGQDYGLIPGTQKPTLLKPGAEKIAKLLGLSDQYEIVDMQENWSDGFFSYLVKCRLVHIGTGVTISEGLGECNSMEIKYRYRWVFHSELSMALQGEMGKVEREKLISKEVSTRTGRAKMYRIDNDEIWSQVNTILKMGKKRALVDAALSAGRLSDVFTQDIEDLPDLVREEPEVTPKTVNKPVAKVESQPEPKMESEEIVETQTDNSLIGEVWLKESLKIMKWTINTAASYLVGKYHVKGGLLEDVIKQLTPEQVTDFVNYIQVERRKKEKTLL